LFFEWACTGFDVGIETLIAFRSAGGFVKTGKNVFDEQVELKLAA
jgi:hypothetical protein